MIFKEYLKKILSDDRLLSLLPDRKVFFLHATNPQKPYIEFEILNEEGAYFEEGVEKETKYILQIDIYSEGSYTSLENTIKCILKENGFLKIGGVDLWEERTKLNHKVLRFIRNYNTEEDIYICQNK